MITAPITAGGYSIAHEEPGTDGSLFHDRNGMVVGISDVPALARDIDLVVS